MISANSLAQEKVIAYNQPIKKKPGRKKKLSKLAQLLLNLPRGFTFTGPNNCCTEEYILSQLKNDLILNSKEKSANKSSNSLQSLLANGNFFTVGLFEVNIDEASVKDLKAMRKLLPRQEYILLKNRKCARLNRYRKRDQAKNLLDENKQLRDDNARLRALLGISKREYSEKECSSYCSDTAGGVDA